MSDFHHYGRLNGEINASTNHDPACIWTCSLLSGMISWKLKYSKAFKLEATPIMYIGLKNKHATTNGLWPEQGGERSLYYKFKNKRHKALTKEKL